MGEAGKSNLPEHVQQYLRATKEPPVNPLIQGAWEFVKRARAGEHKDPAHSLEESHIRRT